MRRIWLALACGLVVSACAPGGVERAEAAERLSIARLTVPEGTGAAPAGEPVVALPTILSAADAARYRALFTAQEAGDWARADALIAALDDRVLMGHVLFQRYMHPTAWRSRFDELAAWLRDYSDHPGAMRIWRLAKRRANGAALPPRPGAHALRGYGEVGSGRAISLPAEKLGVAEKRIAAALRRAVRRLVSRDNPAGAEAVLARAPGRSLLTVAERDSLKAAIARGYFAAGNDASAARLAGAAAARSDRWVPEARWTAGLAAWRRGDAAGAARHFSALAEREGIVTDLIAGGAFWAARAWESLGDPARAERMLRIGADYPRSIYGLMANGLLRKRPDFDWGPPRFGRAMTRFLESNPAARRAAALAEAGDDAGAEAELRRLYPKVGREAGAALLVLAGHLDLAGLEIRLGSHLSTVDGRRHDRALYPLPDWRPDDGFVIDRALVFALVRQESMFDADAKSHAGARGLMQLMPRTASYLDKETNYRWKADALLAPGLNLALGQAYLDHLSGLDHVSNNLVYLLAAYNAGPSRLAEWRRRLDEDDPLMFIESIPWIETRHFVRRVLANLWIYRHRLGQQAYSLDELATARWPVYHAHERLEQLADLTETP